MQYLKNKDIKILYLGTPEISGIVLNALIDNDFSIVGVVTQEDKTIGRNQQLEMSPTKKIALSHSLPIFTPHRIRTDYEWAKSLSFDAIVCMAYGQIVPEEFLKLAPLGALNLHGSLLPKYRGAAPIQRAIMNGDKVTGVTLMEMVAAMDAGRMFDKSEVEIDPRDNYTTLSQKIGEAASRLIVRDLLPYCQGKLFGEEQREKDVTFAAKIKPEDEHLPLTLSSQQTNDYIRGLSMTPGAYVILNGKKLKIFSSHVENGKVIRAVGEIIPNKKELFLQCYDGMLSLEKIQLEGKKPMDAASFLNGAHLSEHEFVK